MVVIQIMDNLINRSKFIEYLSKIVKGKRSSLIIALACQKTNFGRNVIGRNLFLKEWKEDCGKPYVEVDSLKWDGFRNVPIKKKIIKYRSWQECVDDFDCDIEETNSLKGIINLYNLDRFN